VGIQVGPVIVVVVLGWVGLLMVVVIIVGLLVVLLLVPAMVLKLCGVGSVVLVGVIQNRT
jgi:hypothetical protein